MKNIMRSLGLSAIHFQVAIEPYSFNSVCSIGGNVISDMLLRGSKVDFWRLKISMIGICKRSAYVSPMFQDIIQDSPNIEIASCDLVVLRNSAMLPNRLRKPRSNHELQLSQLIEVGDMELAQLFNYALKVESNLYNTRFTEYNQNMICVIKRIITHTALRRAGVGRYFIENLPDLIHMYTGERPNIFILQYNNINDNQNIKGDMLNIFFTKIGFRPLNTYLPNISTDNIMIKLH